jgi:ribosomal-protein-alanine N-acetyltransferase
VNCRIEPAGAAAVEPLALLHRAAFPEEPWEAGAVASILAIPGSFARVGFVDDTAAGLVLARDLGGECEILALGVAPEYRRRGMGGALLQAALDEARRRGLPAAVLEVAADNKAARRLYARAGFVPVGRRAHYYRSAGGGVDALILRASLTAST